MLQILLAICMLSLQEESNVVSVDYSGTGGCSFTVTIGEPVFREFRGYWYPEISGFGISNSAGEFVAPSRTYFIPIPPGCLPEITSTPGGSRRLELPGPLLVSPILTGSGMDAEWEIPPVELRTQLRNYTELDIIHIAGTTVAAVTVEPFASGDHSRIPTELSIQLSWPDRGGSREIDNQLLRALCLPGMIYWPASHDRKASSLLWGRPWARISISSTGFYSVTGAELEMAGCDLEGVPSRSLRMFTGPGMQFDLEQPGEEHYLTELAIEVYDGGDGIFDQSDSIQFFAQDLNRFLARDGEFLTTDGELHRLHHRYATHNVYWLTWGDEDGYRVDTLNAMPDGSPAWGDILEHNLWQEQDYIWLPDNEAQTGWVWTMLYDNIPGYFYFSTSSVDGEGKIHISLISDTNGTQYVSFQLNGELIADTSWSGEDEILFTYEQIPFEASMNLLKVTVGNNPGNVYLDFLRVDYPRRLSYAASRLLRFPEIIPGRYSFSFGGAADAYSLLDVSDPVAPVRLEGDISETLLSISYDVEFGSQFWLMGTGDCLSPDSVRSVEPGRIIGSGIQGDVAVVVADHLLDVVEPIETIYSMRGLSTAIVSASEVYNEFGQGIRDPGAIRSFFRYTQDSWDKPAQSLLLVGDGTYDPLMHVTSSPTLIPVCILLDCWPEAGRNCDDFFVIAHDQGELPEVPISRITASSQAELASYLSKLMLYESYETSGEWVNKILLTADDEWGQYSTNEFRHTLACESLADSVLPRSLDRIKFYLIEYPWPPGTTSGGEHPEKPVAREDFVEELSQGCANMIYFGHGSYGQIAHEKLLVSSDIQRIHNERRQPVMVFATCDIGHFDMISTDCMAEEFALKPEGGSITSIAATRGTFAGSNEILFYDYYTALFSGQNPSAGTSLWLGKTVTSRSYANSRYYVVLGDGGVRPVSPSNEGCSFEVSGDSLQRGMINRVSGSFRNSSAAFLNITESGAETEYTGIGGTSIQYLHYGSSVYRALVTAGTGGQFSAPFFIPVQADTGALSRCSAIGISHDFAEVAFQEWVSLVDDGNYADDSLPPVIESWIDGHRGEDNPTVSGTIILRASVSDSSGICFMGGGAGRSILMSLDSQGFDISRYFTYQPDSYTRGAIEYILPELAEGSHSIILAVWDGMGNQARDTLDFAVTEASSEQLSSVFVYPNPGSGQRCFSFETAGTGTASITIYTIAGRAIWNTAVSCRAGYNQVIWSGLDTDGDEPASGAYIFKIVFSGAEGASSSITDVLAIVHRL